MGTSVSWFFPIFGVPSHRENPVQHEKFNIRMKHYIKLMLGKNQNFKRSHMRQTVLKEIWNNIRNALKDIRKRKRP